MRHLYLVDTIRQKMKTLSAVTVSASLVLASLIPMLLAGQADAAQLSNRSIAISTSKISATAVTYTVKFRPIVTTAIKGIVVQICQDSPLIGVACSTTNGVTATPTTGTITVSQTGGTPASQAFNVVAPSAATGLLVLTHATGITPLTTADMSLSFTATNPSGTTSTGGAVGTFYGRILTYSADTGAGSPNNPANYSATVPNTHIDDGGTAMSTARQLTVNARVQEQLNFCVGTVDNTVTNVATFNTYNGGATAYCTGTAFSSSTPTVDLGPISSSPASISPVLVASGGNNLTGVLLTQTNAFNGATVGYFAEQNGSSGRLKVPAIACSGSTGAPITDAGSSTVDQCFNSNATITSFATASTEEFGMTALTPYQIGTTANLARTANYSGTGASAGGFAWDQSGASTVAIANSTSVLDYEAMLVKFAAQTAPTTPTGSYTVTSTYVATATFQSFDD